MAIGTVNAAEFFVTVTILAALIGALGGESFTVAAAGLLIGGVVSAPISAYLARRIAAKILVRLVGIVLVSLATYGLMTPIVQSLPTFWRL